MNKEINKIYLTKRNSIIIDKETGNTDKVDKRYLATIIKNIESYGYTLSNELIDVLSNFKLESIISFYTELVPILKDLVGYRATKKPLYQNFPKEVMEKEEAELYLDAVIYYLSSFKLTPASELKERYPLISNVDLKVINLGSNEDFMSIFTNLFSSKSSISGEDKSTLLWFVDCYKEDILKYLPEEIPFKENLAYATQICMELDNSISYFKNKYKTATDVLRLATAMSYGDISLATPSRFISFKRKDRKYLLSLLNGTTNTAEDMLRHKNKWIKLGEKLHPFEHKSFKVANQAFYAIRNNFKIETFNSKLEEALLRKDLNEVLYLLKSRPGEFARKLDKLVRTFNESDVLVAFEEIADKVATPLLLQVKEHFLNRNDSLEQRVFFPKGSISKSYVIENNLPTLNSVLCNNIVDICNKSLIKTYSKRESLGKVFISEELKDYIVPTTLRNSSRAIRTLARGSKMPLDKDCNIVRLFLYWRDSKNYGTDLDLSAGLYDENFKNVDNIYFGDLINEDLNCVHSGDVRQAPNGATEFIDLDLNKLKENNIRYIVSSVNAYSGDSFVDLPECFVGFMERVDSESGEIFEPKTVSYKSDISSPNEASIPMIIDIYERKAIWTDLSANENRFSSIRDPKQQGRIEYTFKSIINARKPNMYDLAVLNAIARGEIVETKEEADTIFAVNEGITPFDTDIILAKLI